MLTHPLVALPIWAFNLYIWHIPFLYDAALHHDSVHALEHFMLLHLRRLIWAPVLETLPAPAWFGTGWKIGYIVVVRLIETVLGNVFIWSSAIFYRLRARAGVGITAVARPESRRDRDDGRGRRLVTLGVLAWLFLRLAAEGETRQRAARGGLRPAAGEAGRALRPRGGARALRAEVSCARIVSCRRSHGEPERIGDARRSTPSGRTGRKGARLPIPGNAEWVMLAAASILIAIVAGISGPRSTARSGSTS